jgi:hypothetical protein
VSGFAVQDAAVLAANPDDEDDDGDWVTACDLLTLIDTPRFKEKL